MNLRKEFRERIADNMESCNNNAGNIFVGVGRISCGVCSCPMGARRKCAEQAEHSGWTHYADALCRQVWGGIFGQGSGGLVKELLKCF